MATIIGLTIVVAIIQINITIASALIAYTLYKMKVWEVNKKNIKITIVQLVVTLIVALIIIGCIINNKADGAPAPYKQQVNKTQIIERARIQLTGRWITYWKSSDPYYYSELFPDGSYCIWNCRVVYTGMWYLAYDNNKLILITTEKEIWNESSGYDITRDVKIYKFILDTKNPRIGESADNCHDLYKLKK